MRGRKGNPTDTSITNEKNTQFLKDGGDDQRGRVSTEIYIIIDTNTNFSNYDDDDEKKK